MKKHKCDLLVFGETTLDTISQVKHLPLPEGPAAKINSMEGPKVGGRGANVGTYAAAFGIGVELLTACGPDYFKQYDALALKQGVLRDYIHVSECDKDTAQALVFRDASRAVTYFHPGMLYSESYKKHIRESISALCPKAVYCTSELHGMVHEVFKQYKGSRIVKAYHPGPEIEHVPVPRLTNILQFCDFLFVNCTEKKALESILDQALWQIMATHNIRVAVTTFAEAGAVLTTCSNHDINEVYVPNYPVSREDYKDSTGAGDALSGAFMGSYLTMATEDPILALRFGTAVSSLVVETIGCIVPNLSLSMVQERYNEYCKRYPYPKGKKK